MFTSKRLLPLVGGALAALFLILRLSAGAADMPAELSPWLSASSLNFQKQADVTVLPAGTNLDCYKYETGSCVYETNYGEADSRGYVRMRNSNSYYPVYSYIDGRQHFLPIPNSDGFFTYTTDAVYGAYLYYNYDFINSTELKPDGTTYDFRVVNEPDGKIMDSRQSRLAADLSSISYSESGDWMVFSSPNVGLYRVNLRDLEAVRFADGFDYSKGLSPAPQTAITNDGRYAAMASKDFSSFKIYDLATCSDTIGTCQYRDLSPLVKNHISDFYAVSNLRFIDDDNLGFYGSSYSNGKYSYARYVISLGGSINRQDLLGLGDSYISGEGEFEYLPGTDTDNNKCHLSSLSYPLLLGADLNYDSYHSVACSGATTNDISNISITYGGQTNPRIIRDKLTQAELDKILTNFQPGYIDQLDFVRQYQPKAIVLSVGGNDVNMIGKLKSCIKPGTCYDTYEDRLEFVKDVNNNFLKIVGAYQKLKAAGPPGMRIYVIGYPQIAEPGGDCALNVHLDSDEVIFTTQAISYLDGVIKAAAAKAGVYYVDTEDALYGHRFCEAGPGSVAINGVTAGNDIPNRLGGPIGSESFHPNQFGHQLLENKILSLTDKLTAPMPAADPTIGLPSPDESGILNAPRSGRTISLPEYDPGLVPELAYAGTSIDVSLYGSDHSLTAGTALDAQLHSDPIGLGTLSTDSGGDISAKLSIPADAPAGYHTIHLYGKDITVQPIDIYKDIYIAATADDLDGNGVADRSQACIGVDASGVDADKDGVDDSCDGDIAEQPAAVSPAQPSMESAAPSITAVYSSPAILPTVGNSAATGTNITTTASAPKVLGESTTSTNQSITNRDGKLYVQPRYYAAAGAGFLALSTISYFFKRWWF